MSFVLTIGGTFYRLEGPSGEKIVFDVPVNTVLPPSFDSQPTFVASASPSVHGGTATVHHAAASNYDTLIHYLMRGDELIISGVSDNYVYTFDGAVDDGRSIYVKAVAVSAWGPKTAQSAAIVPKYAKPVAIGSIPAQNLTTSPGAVTTINAASYFTGGVTSYALAPAGAAAIDPVTGVVTISRTNAVTITTITITATNSGGSTNQIFSLTITGTGETTTLAALTTADLDITWELDPGAGAGGIPTDAYTWMFQIKGAGAPFTTLTRLLWAGNAPATPAQALGSGLNPTIAHPTTAKKWIARAYDSTTPDGSKIAPWLWVNKTTPSGVGASFAHCFRWTDQSTGSVTQSAAAYSAISANMQKTCTIGDDPPPVVTTLSKRYPLTSKAEKDSAAAQAWLPGDTLQNCHALDWCRSQPNHVYQIQDTGGLWYSSDQGKSWYCPWRYGLNTFQGLGVAVDPADPMHVLVNMGGSYIPNQPFQGIYRSIDGGKTFMDCNIPGTVDAIRSTHNSIAFGGSALTSGRTSKILAIAAGKPTNGVSLVNIGISTNAGSSWTIAGEWNQSTYGEIIFLAGDKSNANRFWAATTKGLHRITTSGTGMPTITLWSGSHGLDELGGQESPPIVSDDGQTIFCARGGSGIYRSTDGGSNFSKLGTHTLFSRAFVNPYDFDKALTITDQSTVSADTRPYYCNNLTSGGGADFTRVAEADVERRPDGITTPPKMSGNYSAFAFHTDGGVYLHGIMTRTPDSANQYRSQPSFGGGVWGKTWKLANKGYCGGNFSMRGQSPNLWASADRCVLPIFDLGPFVSTERGAWLRGIGRTLPASDDKSHLGVIDFSTHGAAISATTVLAAVGDDARPVLCRSTDSGNTWDAVASASFGAAYTYTIIKGTGSGSSTIWFYGNKKSTNDGVTFSAMGGGLPSSARVCATTWTAGTQAIFAEDDANSANPKIWRSSNQGTTWSQVLSIPFKISQTGLAWGPTAAHPDDSNYFFTKGSNNRTIRRWNISTGTYTDFNIFGSGASVPSGYGSATFEIKRLAIDPRHPEIMAVITSNSGTPRAFRTTDYEAGTAWTELGGDVIPTCCNVNGVAFSPFTGDLVIGGSNGMHVIAPTYAQTSPATLFSTTPYENFMQQ